MSMVILKFVSFYGLISNSTGEWYRYHYPSSTLTTGRYKSNVFDWNKWNYYDYTERVSFLEINFDWKVGAGGLNRKEKPGFRAGFDLFIFAEGEYNLLNSRECYIFLEVVEGVV